MQGCNPGRPCCVGSFVETNNDNTAAVASIDDITECEARADAQVRVLLGRVLAQKRSAGVALDYVTALAPGTKANCWALAEAAGHEGWGRMQGLLRCYQWDWKELRAQLPALAAGWIPGEDEDLIGRASRSTRPPSSSTATARRAWRRSTPGAPARWKTA